jgi:hypothetical protein
MSQCVSAAGEYSSHKRGGGKGAQQFLCSRCGVLDEFALSDAYDELFEQTLRVHRLSGEVFKRPNRMLDVYELNRALRGGEDKQQ